MNYGTANDLTYVCVYIYIYKIRVSEEVAEIYLKNNGPLFSNMTKAILS